jgi:hypothetical protein
MPSKPAARHAQTRSRRGWLIGAAVAAVLAVVLVAALVWRPGSDDADSDTAAPAASSASPTPSASSESPSSTPSSGETGQVRQSKPLRACAASITEEERAVDAASQGVTNWRDHVQARTDMLDGRIPVAKMDAVWARTRAAGPADQERFKKALPASDQTACGGLEDASGSDQKVADRCVQRSRAATRALESAEAAMQDWEDHLANMAMFADKEMSATMAQEKWVQSWRNAPKNISAYNEARAALAEAPACPGAAS